MQSITVKFTVHKEIAAGLAAIAGSLVYGALGMFVGAGLVCAAWHVMEVRKA